MDVQKRLFLDGLVVSDLEVHGSLLFVHFCSDVSRFEQFFAQPVGHGEDVLVVETLDLMGIEDEGASHFLETFGDFFRKLDFVS